MLDMVWNNCTLCAQCSINHVWLIFISYCTNVYFHCKCMRWTWWSKILKCALSLLLGGMFYQDNWGLQKSLKDLTIKISSVYHQLHCKQWDAMVSLLHDKNINPCSNSISWHIRNLGSLYFFHCHVTSIWTSNRIRSPTQTSYI